MKVALYYPWIYLRSGVEKTILELTKRSRHSWTIFTSHFDPAGTFSEFKDKTVIELKRISVSRSYPSVLRAAIKILFQRIDLKKYDLLWVHSEGLGDLITFLNNKKPNICFCHTPLKIIHDPCLRQAYIKDNKKKRIFFKFFSFIFRLIDRLAFKNYKHIFCTSEEVKNRILKAGLSESSKIEVIYRGIDSKEITPSWIYDHYFLHPSRIKWWKNIGLSIEAFHEFHRIFKGQKRFKLIIAGQVDTGSTSYYRKLIDLCHKSDFIQIIANPSEKELVQLYRNCYAMLNTTLNEDWGVGILEAMAYGKAVIAVNRGGPKESIISGKTGFLVEPTGIDFARAMVRLAENENVAQEMGREARQASLKYEWAGFVRRVDDYIDSLA